MGADRELRVRFIGDAASAQKATKAVDDGLSKLGPSGTIAENALSKVTSQLTSHLGPASGEAQKALDAIGKGAITSGGLLGTAVAGGAAVAAGALLKFAADGIGKFVELTGEIRAFDRVAGTSAEEGSKLVGALHLLGIEPDVASKAIGILSRNIEQHSQKLAADGIEIAKNKDGTSNLIGTLFNVADAYNKTSDQAQKNTIALDAFGRGGLALIPILQRGRDGIQELFNATGRSGLIFDQAALDRGRQFALASKEMKDSFSGLEISVGQHLIPLLIEGTHIVTTLTDGVNHVLSAKLPGGTTLFDDIVHGAASAIPGVGQITAAVGLFGSKSHDTAASEKDLAAAEEEATRQADAQAKAIEAVISAESKLVDSTLGVIGAEDSLHNSQDGLRKAQADYTKAVQEHGPASQEAAAAEQALEQAGHGLLRSYVDLAKAQADQTINQREANGETLTAQDKQDVLKTKLQEVAGTVGGPLHDALLGLAGDLKTAQQNSNIVITATADVSPAEKTLAAFENALNKNPNLSYDVFLKNQIKGARASGGPVRGGSAYIVGEHGPEVFIAPDDGTVVPNGGRLGPAGPSSTGPTVVVQLAMPNYLGSKDDLMAFLEREAAPAVLVGLQRLMGSNGLTQLVRAS